MPRAVCFTVILTCATRDVSSDHTPRTTPTHPHAQHTRLAYSHLQHTSCNHAPHAHIRHTIPTHNNHTQRAHALQFVHPQAVIDSFQTRLEAVDWVTFLTRDVIMILTTHLQTLRQADMMLEHFPSHPALVSHEAEIRYVREMMDVFLQCVLPKDQARSTVYRSMLREMLTENIHRNINMVADYDYVNQVPYVCVCVCVMVCVCVCVCV